MAVVHAFLVDCNECGFIAVAASPSRACDEMLRHNAEHQHSAQGRVVTPSELTDLLIIGGPKWQ